MTNPKAGKMSSVEAAAIVAKLGRRARSPLEQKACNLAVRALKSFEEKDDLDALPAANDLLSSHELAKSIQCDPSSVVKWINDSKLPSFSTPGGHRRIRRIDAIRFMEAHSMMVPAALIQPLQDKH